MSTDDFTTAARDRANALWQVAGEAWARRIFVAGAVWARTHLAAQEADAGRAVRELHEPGLAYRLIGGEDFAQEPDGDVCKECGDYYPCGTIQALDAARAALTTAREARP